MNEHGLGGLQRRPVALLAALVLLSFAFEASAHQVGLSRGAYAIDGVVLNAELTFARSELIGLLAELDRDHDERLSESELAGAAQPLERALASRIEVEDRGRRCPGTVRNARLVEGDGAAIALAFTCAQPIADAGVVLRILDDLPFGHRHLAMLGTQAEQSVLYRDVQRFTLATAAPGAAADDQHWFLGFVFLGVEHILVGFDHLVFLFGLLIVGGSFRSLCWTISAFTIAHSLTLALAALGVVQPSPSLVEPLIALSIAYVGVENLLRRDKSARFKLSFGFGLIHGFGFAGALAERGLPHGQVPLALLGFNVGVELGQLAVLAVVLPLLAWVARARQFHSLFVPGASIAVVLAGLGWFVERVAAG